MFLSVIIPANNEEALIGACLSALSASTWQRRDPVQVIVVANGCTDDTADVARRSAPDFARKGWQLDVIDRPEGGKLGALNAGDAAALSQMRVYVDADVTVSPGLIAGIAQALDTDAPRYASGRVQIAANGWVSRAYARIWRQVPFMADCVPGCGVFAVNAAGRTRWGSFPDIISDDTYIRLLFTPEERLDVPEPYRWPIAEGLGALIKVRRRQDVGVDEIARDYPQLLDNDDKPAFPLRRKLAIAGAAPISFAIYSAVAVMSKLTRGQAKGWSRGR